MSGEWVTLGPWGAGGVNTDLVPSGLPPNVLTWAENVRPVGDHLGPAGGYLTLRTLPAEDLDTLFFSESFDTDYLLIAGVSSVYQWDGSAFTLISDTDFSSGSVGRWSGGWLNGGYTLANQEFVRTWKQGVDTYIQPMQYDPDTGDTWEDLNYQGAVFRPFRDYMMAGNLTLDGDEYPTRLAWCDPVEPGQVPDDWVPRDDNFAGFRDLADSPGPIVDMLPLRDYLMIYKRDAVYLCQWVGGNEVFSIRRLDVGRGMVGRNCAVSYQQRHWVIDRDDIYVTDGNSVQSILWGKVKNYWLANRCQDRSEMSFACLDEKDEEVLFFYVSKDCTEDYPNKVISYSYQKNTLFPRDYNVSISHAHGFPEVSSGSSIDQRYYALDKKNHKLLALEDSVKQGGAATPFILERTGLLSAPGHYWTQVDEGTLSCQGQRIFVQLGDQVAPGASVTWRDSRQYNPATSYKFDNRANGNQIAFRVEGSTIADWRIAEMNLLVQKSGSRG